MPKSHRSSPPTAPSLFIARPPYWLKKEAIAKIEALRKSTFMGHWCVRDRDGNWSETPVDVFYQPTPDLARGHKHYFGLLIREEQLLICDATSAFSEPITGIAASDGEVLVSRFRHDCQIRKGIMIDGGRDYIRHSGPFNPVQISVEGAEFRFERISVSPSPGSSSEPAGAG